MESLASVTRTVEWVAWWVAVRAPPIAGWSQGAIEVDSPDFPTHL